MNEQEKAEWRKRAIDWLKADLGVWTGQVEKGTREAKETIRRTLEQWKSDPGLAGVRDERAVKTLAEEEQKAWRGLWGEVETLLERTKR